MSSGSDLPPGFRFYPTDEELVVHFLQRKASLLPCHPDIIPDLELFPYDPWDIQGRALSEGRKWYYYSRKISSQNRMTQNGYWKAMGSAEPVLSSSSGKRVGMKMSYMFYIGHDSSSGTWTNWIMHEYRLLNGSSSSNGRRMSRSRSSSTSSDRGRWVVCKVFEQTEDSGEDDSSGTDLSCLDEVFLSMDDYDETSYPSWTPSASRLD